MMNLSSSTAFLAWATSSAFLVGKAAAGVEEHFGVGFNTKFMSNPPSHDDVTDKILPELKDTLGISNFRIYNAIVDADYVADLIYGNRESKFIVDIGFIWWSDIDQIAINELTQEDVDRYITHYIDTVGKTVKDKLGVDYEWLDNVGTIGYINEPWIEWLHWWTDVWPTLPEAAQGLNKLNRMTQNFFNTYKDGKYKTKITIAPIFIGSAMGNFTEIMLEESIKLQAEAGAPLAVYSNLYACHPVDFDSYTVYYGDRLPFEYLAACIGMPGQDQEITGMEVSSMVEKGVTEWEALLEELNIPVDPSEIKFVITETGWPTDGFDFGSEYMAGSYYNSLIRLMNDPSSIMHGVDVYFFEALDENLKPNLDVEPWWGLMYGNGTIKAGIKEGWPWPFDDETAEGTSENLPMELIHGQLTEKSHEADEKWSYADDSA